MWSVFFFLLQISTERYGLPESRLAKITGAIIRNWFFMFIKCKLFQTVYLKDCAQGQSLNNITIEVLPFNFVEFYCIEYNIELRAWQRIPLWIFFVFNFTVWFKTHWEYTWIVQWKLHHFAHVYRINTV